MMSGNIINICKGWGCGIAPHCNKYRFVPEEERRGAYIKEFIPTCPGSNCTEYEEKRGARWGNGADGND
jgi:hypothetical protein